jgi:GntR family transcriptional repressor for pyruvate dehydrogenase complex
VIQSPHLAPIARTTLTDEIVKRLVGLIIDQGLQPGAKLPSERELAARLSVGRSSLREAIKTLSTLGIVEVAVGEGMFVGRGESSILAKPLSWGLLMGERSTRELIEARRVVEVELAGLAAERATDVEIATIGMHLDRMRGHLDDPDAYSRCDVEFHLAVASGGHNRVLHHMVDTVRQILRVWMVEVLLSYPDKNESLNQHIPIEAAIRARDVQAARDAMAAHLDSAGQRLMAISANR